MQASQQLKAYFQQSAPTETTYTFRVTVYANYRKDIDITINPSKGDNYATAVKGIENYIAIAYPNNLGYIFKSMKEKEQ